MKRIITLCFALFLTAFAFAQTPQLMGYQAIIRNTNNQLVVNNSVGLQVSILQGSATGSSVYVERHFPRTNTNGLISINIGAGTTVSGVFGSINWANGTYFLKTETDLNGGSNYTISGTSQLLSVPYALNAKNAEKARVADTADYNKLTNKPKKAVYAYGGVLPGGQATSSFSSSANYTSKRKGVGVYEIAFTENTYPYFDLNSTVLFSYRSDTGIPIPVVITWDYDIQVNFSNTLIVYIHDLKGNFIDHSFTFVYMK